MNRPRKDDYAEEAQAGRADYELARARHEAAKADLAELDLGKRRHQLLEVQDVQAASATAVAVLVQTLRGVRDSLERKHGLPTEVLDAIDLEINQALEQVAIAFKVLAGE